MQVSFWALLSVCVQSHTPHRLFFVCKLINAVPTSTEEQLFGGVWLTERGTQVPPLLLSVRRMTDCLNEVSVCRSIMTPQVERKPGPTKKLSQIGKHTVWGCLALQHMLCDCAFKAACQKKLGCSRPHMSASRCRHLPDSQARDSEEKEAHLKAPQNQQVCERVQLLYLGQVLLRKSLSPESNPGRSEIPACSFCAR